MDRALELEITEHVLKLVEAHTSDLAPSTYEVPIRSYTDENRASLERDQLFRNRAQLAALSCELPSPGDWKSIEMAGVPVLVMRNSEGQVGAFLNVCRHRGMRVAEGRGQAVRLSCPYHAWSYNNTGALATVPAHEQGFTGMCLEDKGLVPVPVAERHGSIWVVPNADHPGFDVDEHLGDVGDEFATWDLGSWHHLQTYEHVGTKANWKIALESYIENYHVKVLHKDTIAAYAKAYGGYHTNFGDHQRISFPNEPIHDLEGLAKEDWQAFDTGALAVVYHFFPASLFVMFFNHVQLFQIFPGPTADTSTTYQSLFVTKPPTDAVETQAIRDQFSFVFDVVDKEDYVVARKIQESFDSGANDVLILGRQEIALHHIHETCQRILGPVV